MLPFSIPTPDALDAILMRDTRILELGAGEGLWAQALRDRGADVVALDPVPRGPGVQIGSHLDADSYPDRSLLICWPPDGTQVETWITGPRRYLFLIGSHSRFFYAAAGPLELDITLPTGRKSGPNNLRIYRL